MTGPLPKDPALRQRRNKASTRATLSPVSGRRRCPALPARSEGEDWQSLTLDWWRDVWQSPMAAEYLKADIHGLYRLAVLVDMFWQSPSMVLAAEITREQAMYGLSPLDRRRLEWIVERAEEGKARKAPRKRPASEGDPRELLRAVK